MPSPRDEFSPSQASKCSARFNLLRRFGLVSGCETNPFGFEDPWDCQVFFPSDMMGGTQVEGM